MAIHPGRALLLPLLLGLGSCGATVRVCGVSEDGFASSRCARPCGAAPPPCAPSRCAPCGSGCGDVLVDLICALARR